jgi:drug/metabolite transporter (DMT)-like permease
MDLVAAGGQVFSSPMNETASNPLRGLMWMVAAGLCFVAVAALVKFMDGRVPAAQAAFLRYVLGLGFLIPLWSKLRALRPTRRQWGLITVRGVAHTVGVVCWFYGMTWLPIAEVTAMGYITPIATTILAVVILGERLAARRILAVLLALAGALIILRPGFRELQPGHFAMLGTAMFFAAGYLSAKILSGEFSASIVVGMLSITVTIGLAPLAYAVWQPVLPIDLVILFAVACCATVGHYFMTRAFAAAPVSVTQPATFLQLVWSVLLGIFMFGDAIDMYVIVGGTVIVAAVSFISWREAVLRRRITALVPETKL